ncbi:hypothetical protein BLA29_000019 [Euroglyphus maynei]|uniref:Uncharacterized protein n=1 Tax=Euroglyphus maynei TaxID=6958 RepID=A0A1Y3AXH4_EURMA|nr:hypothetical protein BLA29_000019 [Euroglyphus maynei]
MFFSFSELLRDILAELQDDEFCRANRGQADFDDHLPLIDFFRGHGEIFADLNKPGVGGGTASQCALLPQTVQITVYGGFDALPGRLAVGFKHQFIQGFLNIPLNGVEQAAYRDIAPVIAVLQRAGAPHHGALARERADHVQRLALVIRTLKIIADGEHRGNAIHGLVGRRFPHATRTVGLGNGGRGDGARRHRPTRCQGAPRAKDTVALTHHQVERIINRGSRRGTRPCRNNQRNIIVLRHRISDFSHVNQITFTAAVHKPQAQAGIKSVFQRRRGHGGGSTVDRKARYGIFTEINAGVSGCHCHGNISS